jgi:hypothetical protein
LLFNDKVEDGSKIPGLSGEMEKKKKKKNKKKSAKDDQDDETTPKKEKKQPGDQAVNMEGATSLFSEEEDAGDETKNTMSVQNGRQHLQNIIL